MCLHGRCDHRGRREGGEQAEQDLAAHDGGGRKAICGSILADENLMMDGRELERYEMTRD